ncbi:hypothetical protein JOD29_000813 [Lysinibacillus composti]|uniref:Rho termination factor N-terminal domain-containing protein n=1 Tax=Lysinibacillus composti TaxID=720633 RepID=A0A3N9UVK7_9BACI|nr:hypothetical protein [Lysinibacillus composti]MBM7607569.1 hypothetical protein [Lysinibacillus composti]RQW75926.1 hypothetical protein EBB45_04730 [Lysinibacillus composti]
MKYKVLKSFIDSVTGIGFNIGNTFESTDSERVSYLASKGYIYKPEEQKQTKENQDEIVLDELKAKAKELSIKGYTKMSEEELTAAIDAAEAEKASE